MFGGGRVCWIVLGHHLITEHFEGRLEDDPTNDDCANIFF